MLIVATIAPAADRHPRVEGRLFVSPMGEPFRSDRDGDPAAAWFAGADTNGDGRISCAEFEADAMRWFAVADRGHDGEIDPDDIDWYENDLVPEIRVADAPRGASRPDGDTGGSSGRGPGRPGGGMDGRGGHMGSGGFGGHHGGGGSGDGRPDAARSPTAAASRRGAARYSYLDLPEPLTAADANGNRGIDKAEMMRAADDRFALLDKNGDGYLDKRELPRVDTRSSGPGPHAPRPGPERHPDAGRQLGGGDREQD